MTRQEWEGRENIDQALKKIGLSLKEMIGGEQNGEVHEQGVVVTGGPGSFRE
jgi:hypothetical protein